MKHLVLALLVIPAIAQSGDESYLGLTREEYKYSEDNMSLSGTMVGVKGSLPARSDYGQFLLDIEASQGYLDYSSKVSGQLDHIKSQSLIASGYIFNEIPVYLTEVRFGSGLKYAYFSNDGSKKLTTENQYIYPRENKKFYIPVFVGISFDSRLASHSFKLEYDYLIHGEQLSKLTGESIRNTQKKGRGIKLSYQVVRNKIGVEAFVYESKTSRSEAATCFDGKFLCTEPENSVLIIGASISRHF